MVWEDEKWQRAMQSDGIYLSPVEAPITKKRCTKTAVALQIMRHTAVMARIQRGEFGFACERAMCAEHADVIDPEWIDAGAWGCRCDAVGVSPQCPLHGDVQCEWADVEVETS